MDLREELERLKKLKSERVLHALEGKLHRAQDYFAQKAEHPNIKNIEELLPAAERVRTPFGVVVRNRLRCQAGSDDAAAWIQIPRLDMASRVLGSHLAQLSRDATFNDIALDQIAFVDVETTGLAGGTGTYPFLIGIGHFCQGGFCVEPHLDLLYLSRRLWRKRLSECSLGCVEREILRIERSTDIDASFIPRIYFDYTRGVRRDMMLPVFAHNAQDVASMAALLLRFAHYLDNPESDELTHATDLIGLSKIFELNGMIERAVDCMERALLYAKDDALSHLISAHIAKIYKRQQRWAEAVEIWHSHIEAKVVFHLEAFVELAKYYEHREKDHHRAKTVVEKALRYLAASKELEEYLGTEVSGVRFDRMIDALDHRLKRLRKRVDKMSVEDDD
jgi:uncharacterized protein YprB with RNaseH-like and TPR domain